MSFKVGVFLVRKINKKTFIPFKTFKMHLKDDILQVYFINIDH